MEQLADDFRHQRSCHTKSGSSSGQQCKDSQKVNQTAANSICLFSQNRTARLAVFLTVSFSYMKHKAKRNSQYQIESPRDKAPVKQWKYACPVLNAAKFCDVRICCVQNPLRERIKQNICCKAARKHHRSPGKKGIFRFLVLLPQYNRTIFRKRQIQREQKNTKSNCKIIDSKGISQKEAYLCKDCVGLFRQEEKQNTEHCNHSRRQQRDHPVNLPFFLYFSALFLFLRSVLINRTHVFCSFPPVSAVTVFLFWYACRSSLFFFCFFLPCVSYPQ